MNEIIMVCHSVNNNTRSGLVKSCCLNTKTLIGLKFVSQPGKIIPSETTHRKKVEEETEAAIVSQPSKCLKFETFREGCFMISN